MITGEQFKQYRLLTDWFISVLEAIKDEDGSKVLTKNANSLEWLAGHLILTRSRNVTRLGGNITPYQYEYLYVDSNQAVGTFKPFDQTVKYPSLQDSIAQWSEYSKLFLELLEKADEKILKTELPIVGPTGGNTVADLLVSAILHEAFHIGQMSIIRKSLGYKAMYWFHRL